MPVYHLEHGSLMLGSYTWVLCCFHLAAVKGSRRAWGCCDWTVLEVICTASWSACSGQFFPTRWWSYRDLCLLSFWEGDLKLIALDPCAVARELHYFPLLPAQTAPRPGFSLPCSHKNYLPRCLTPFSLFLNSLSLGQGLKFLKW